MIAMWRRYEGRTQRAVYGARTCYDDENCVDTMIERDRYRYLGREGGFIPLYLPDSKLNGFRNPADTDDDGVVDAEELDGDLDLDGLPNTLDPDDDGDGIATWFELLDGELIDTEGDGRMDPYGSDDDDDDISTRSEFAHGRLDRAVFDFDADSTLNWLDEDSDGDGAWDIEEGDVDSDGDLWLEYLDISGCTASSVEVCGNSRDDHCEGAVDGPDLCDLGSMIDVGSFAPVPGAPDGYAWDAPDVEFPVNFSSTSNVDRVECRSGKRRADGSFTSVFKVCPRPYRPDHDPSMSGDGAYRTEFRLVDRRGAVGPVLGVNDYLHQSLSGATGCVDRDPEAMFAAARAALWLDGISDKLQFDLVGDANAPGAIRLSAPFVRIHVTPPVVHALQMSGPGNWSNFGSEPDMELLSLRRRFALSEDGTMVAMWRHYESRRHNANNNGLGDYYQAFGLMKTTNGWRDPWESRSRVKPSYGCQAIVMNRRGAGLCLIDGGNSYILHPGTSSPTSYLQGLAAPHRRAGPAQSEGRQSAVAQVVVHLLSGSDGAPLRRSVDAPMNRSETGQSVRWGPRHFSPYYEGASCVNAYAELELEHGPGPGFEDLYLPDAASYDF